MLHLLKYERVRALAKPLARMLAIPIATLQAEAPQDLLVIAVPLFAAREKQRGFNQTVLLADEAMRLLRSQQPGWRLQAGHRMLVRQRSTESQFQLSSSARRTNLRGAFSVPKAELVAGRDILLVDDIYTTGATARECSRTLLRAGARSVWVATLSRAQVETYTVWDEASFAASVQSRQATGVWQG
ncbi:MAG: ComF family protein [Acidobacteriaceae bacterium]